jgi:hypothetical protein
MRNVVFVSVRDAHRIIRHPFFYRTFSSKDRNQAFFQPREYFPASPTPSSHCARIGTHGRYIVRWTTHIAALYPGLKCIAQGGWEEG